VLLADAEGVVVESGDPALDGACVTAQNHVLRRLAKKSVG
jgi:hypothetical protein